MIAPLMLTIASVFKSQGLNQARQALSSAGKDFESFAGSVGAAAGAFGAFQAIAGAREFIVGSVDMTQRFERNMLALKQVFEETTPTLANFTRQVESYGLSQSQAAQASVFLGSVLKQYGFSVNESADQTQRLVTLAQDLATTYGYDVQEALLAITALFRGEYDPIEKFGVAMKQAEVNARVAADGLGHLEGAEQANAQATARLTMLFERAGDSMGAFSRASDTLYASQQRLNAVIQNLQVAFGAPLQQPLAEINTLFSDLAKEFGPDLIEVAVAIGNTLGTLSPTFALVGRTALELVSTLQQIIEILNFVTFVISSLLAPALVMLNGTLGVFNGLLDVGSALLNRFAQELGGASNESDAFKQLLENLGIDPDKENSLESYVRRLNALVVAIQKSGGAAVVFNSNMHLLELGFISTATESTNLKNKTNALDVAMRAIATGSKDAEGKLGGLAGVFQRLDDAIEQSMAKQSMEELGLSAGFIEEALSRPNWKEIFEVISTYAKIAAVDVAEIGNAVGRSMIMAERSALQDRLNELFAASDPKTTAKATKNAEKVAKDVVKAFTNSLRDETEKLSATSQLAVLGASAGLIEKILNTDGWKKVWLSIKNGTMSVTELQKAFNKTAAGAQELKDISDAAAEAAAKQAKAILDSYEEQQEALGKQIEAIRDIQKELEKVAILETLPQEEEIGRYENSIISQFGNIKDAIQKAFDNEAILRDSYEALMRYASDEQIQLQAIARQRDDVARRYDLAKALIAEYQSVFRSALNLNSLLNSIEQKSKNVTVTQFTEGVVKMGKSLREFRVTLTREWEEKVQETVNKSQALVTKFQEMAVKARAFAENLRRLRDMGLDPMLFNQLVEAGVEAGGETAQALIDGGQSTIDEVSNLFREIDSLGGKLGEEVARGLYGDGVAMGTGLLEGLKSLATQFENTGKILAEAFTKKFTADLNAAIEAAIAKLTQIVSGDLPLQTETGTDSMGMPQLIIAPDIPVTMPSVIVIPDAAGVMPGDFTPRPGGSPFPTTTINVNVRTDPTQSPAQVGQTIVTAINRATQIGVGSSTSYGVA